MGPPILSFIGLRPGVSIRLQDFTHSKKKRKPSTRSCYSRTQQPLPTFPPVCQQSRVPSSTGSTSKRWQSDRRW
jgi:hypothetical protein